MVPFPTGRYTAASALVIVVFIAGGTGVDCACFGFVRGGSLSLVPPP